MTVLQGVAALHDDDRLSTKEIRPCLGQPDPARVRCDLRDLGLFGRQLNPRWDNDFAEKRLAELDIPVSRKVGTLSGGQMSRSR